jgi:hypothetical protein
MPTAKRIAATISAVLATAAVLAAGALATHYTYSNSATLAAGELSGAHAECPRGWRAPWGGFSAQFGPDGGAEPTEFRARGDAWALFATNTGETEHGVRVEAYCRPDAPKLTRRSRTVVVRPLATRVAVARCEPGETLLAAGFRGRIEPGGAHVVVDGMRRVGARDLRITAANLSADVSGRAAAYAYCGHGPRPIVASSTAVVPAAGSERFVARCPGDRGEMADVFSGFQASPADPASGAVTSPAQFRYGGKEKLIVTAVDRSATESATMTAFVYCR